MAVELAVAYVSIVPSTSKLAGEVRKELGAAEKESERAGKGIGGRLASGLKMGAKVAGGAVAGLLGTSLVKGFGRLVALDTARGKLLGLGHSAETVQGIMDNALAAVTGTAFGMDEAATTAAGAVAAGIKPGKDLTDVLTLVGDAATIGGVGMAEMGAIFNKVAASGKVQGDVLAQLGDQGIPIVQFLAEELGVSAEETYKLASAGEINFATFRKAMENGLGGAAKASGNTFVGAWKNMWAAVGRVGANVLSGVFPLLIGAFGDITQALKPLEAGAKQVGAVLGQFAAAAVAGLRGIASGGEGAVGFMGRLRQAANDIVASPLGRWVADVARDMGGTFLGAMRDVGGVIARDLWPGLRDAAAGFLDLARTVVNSPITGFILSVLKPVIMGFVDGVVLAVKGLVGVITGVVNVIAGVLTGDFARIWTGLKGIVVGAVQAVWGVLQAGFMGRILGLFRAFGPLVSRLATGPFSGIVTTVKTSLGGVIGFVTGWVTRVMNALAGFGAGLVSRVAGALQTGIVTPFSRLWGLVGPFVTRFVSGVISTVAGVARALISDGAAILAALARPFHAVWGVVAPLVSSFVTRVIGFFSGLASRLGSVLSTVGNVIAAPFRGIANVVGPLVTALVSRVVSLFTSLVSSVAGVLSRIVQTVTAPFTAIAARVVPTIRSFADAVVLRFLYLVDNVRSAFTTLAGNAVVGAFMASITNVGRAVADFVTRAVNAIVGFGRNVASTFSTIGSTISGWWNRALTVLRDVDRWFTTVLVTAAARLLAGVVNAWTSMRAGIESAWTTIQTRILAPLVVFFTSTVPTAANTLRNLVTVAWTALRTSIEGVFARVRSAVLDPIRVWFTVTLPTAAATLRNLVTAAWNALRATIEAVFGQVRSRILDPLRVWFTATLPAAATTLRNLVTAAWNALRAAVESAFGAVRTRILDPLRVWFVTTLPAAATTLRTLVTSAWNALRSAIQSVWDGVRTRILDPIRVWFTQTLPQAGSSMQSTVARHWNTLGSNLRGGYDRTIKPVFDTLKRVVDSVKDWFAGAVRAIGGTWGGLVGAISGPINTAKSWVNRNLVDRMNSVLGTVGVSFRVSTLATGGVIALANGGLWPGTMRAASGRVLPGYTPRRDVHRFYSPTGGRLDLSGGEAVMVPEWTRAVGGARAVAAMNRAARSGGASAVRRQMGTTAAFADGGIYYGYRAPATRRFAGGGILDALLDPVEAVKKAVTAIVDRIPGGNFAWETSKGFARKLVAGVVDKVREMFSFGSGDAVDGGGSGSVMGWQRQWAWAKANLPGVRLHSGYRPGARTAASGNVSYHARGRAIDITPSMAMFNKIKAAFFRNIAELIFSPANSAQVYKGRNHYFSSPVTRRMHFDHIHWAMNRGGVLPKLYDQGGMLRKGDLAMHAAARPDRVLTDRQWARIERYLPVREDRPTGYASAGLGMGDVNIHGDVYGDPDAYARAIERRRRDQAALLAAAGRV